MGVRYKYVTWTIELYNYTSLRQLSNNFRAAKRSPAQHNCDKSDRRQCFAFFCVGMSCVHSNQEFLRSNPPALRSTLRCNGDAAFELGMSRKNSSGCVTTPVRDSSYCNEIVQGLEGPDEVENSDSSGTTTDPRCVGPDSTLPAPAVDGCNVCSVP
eukprot:3101421-Rhodomonas_salina.3